MMCQSIGRDPISTIGFGLMVVSSASRVPFPPAKIATFIRLPCPSIPALAWFLGSPADPQLYPASYPFDPRAVCIFNLIKLNAGELGPSTKPILATDRKYLVLLYGHLLLFAATVSCDGKLEVTVRRIPVKIDSYPRMLVRHA